MKTKQIEKKSHPTQREAIAPETLPRKKFHFASSTSTRSPFSSCTPPATTNKQKKNRETIIFFYRLCCFKIEQERKFTVAKKVRGGKSFFFGCYSYYYFKCYVSYSSYVSFNVDYRKTCRTQSCLVVN